MSSSSCASVLLRAAERDGAFEGYVAKIDAEKGEISILCHRDGKIEMLGGQTPFVREGDFADFEAWVEGDRIGLVVAGSGLAVQAADPITDNGRFGVNAWGGSVTFDNLAFTIDGGSYRIADIDYSRSMFASSETGAAPIAAGSGIVIAPDPQRAERRVLAELVSLLFDLNEFIYLD